ncbi:MAG: serine/threonine protein kinase [Magnetococcales bacterium]|nr:serine/threonine protein kinase [Nitrospirota bacterium]
MKATEWTVGDVLLDLYEVREVYKSGGMGVVYRIFHRGWNVELAMKSPRPEYFQKEEDKRNFEREAETWMDLGLHPNIVSCYYIRRIDDVPRVFAEYLGGGNLRDRIRKRKLTTLEDILDIAIQFATGLHYAHEKGLVHQDVKPANVMLSYDGIVKVTDFGLAKARALTDTKAIDQDINRGMLVSYGGMTPAYCSPEQASSAERSMPTLSRSALPNPAQQTIVTPTTSSLLLVTDKALSTKTDIWSWGVSILEIFVGGISWMTGSIADIALDNYLQNGPMDDIIPPMPTEIVNLLKRCLQKMPEDRPASMLEIAEELRRIYRDITGKAYPRTQYLAGRATADGINNRAISLLDLKKTSGIDALWKEALKTDPLHFESTYNLALYEWKNGTITERDIIRRIKAITIKRHMNWRECHMLGNLYMFSGNYSKAVEELWKAVESEHPSAAEIKDLVLALCAEGRVFTATASSKGPAAITLWKDVERQCRNIIEDIPTGAEKTQERPETEKTKERPAAVKNVDPHIVSACTLALTRQGRQKEAYEFYTSYRDKSPGMPSSATEAFHRYLPGFEILHTIEEHNGMVASIAITPDSKRAISAGSDDKTVRVWDIEEGKCLTTLYGHTDWVTCVCVSSDGRFAVSGSNDKTLRLWDIGYSVDSTTGRCVRVISDSARDGSSEGNDPAKRITAVAVTPDSKYILAGFNDGALLLFSLVSGLKLRHYDGHRGRITSVAITPDGLYAVSGSTDTTVSLYNIVTGKLLRTFTGHTGGVTSVAISPSGTLLLTGSEDKTMRLYNLATAQCAHTFRGHTGEVLCVAFSDQQSLVVSGSKDETLCLWDIRSRQRVFLFKKFEGPALAITPSGRRAVYSIWNGIRIVEIANHYPLSYAIAIPVSSVESEEREAAFRKEIQRARDLIRANNIMEIPEIIKKARDIKGYEKDRDALEIKEQLAAYFPKKELLGAWQLNTWQLNNPAGHTGGVNAVAVTQDDACVIAGAEDGRLYMWELDSGELRGVFEGHQDSVTTLDISADGRYVISGSKDKTVRLWELPTRTTSAQTFYGHTLYGHSGSISKVVFGTDPRYALSQDYKGLLLFWDLVNKESVRTLYDKEGCTVAALYPDLRYAISGRADGVITIWDIALEERSRTFKMLNKSVTAVAVSSDGRFILTGGLYDGTLQLWDFRSGRSLRSFTGHTGGITTLCFSSDVRYILSVGVDKTIRIWDIDTSRELRKFTLHGEDINTAVLSPNGWLVITGSKDRTLSSFYLDWDIVALNYEDWDDRALPYLETFLTLHTPLSQNTLLRRGMPQYSEEDFDSLLRQLSLKGFGWLTPEGVRQKLNYLRKNAADKSTEAQRTHKMLIGLSLALIREGMKEGATDHDSKVVSALETIKKARSINGYARDEQLLRIYDKISSVFPKKDISAAWKVRYFKNHKAAINTLAVSPNGKYAISGGNDRNVCLWNIESRTLVRGFAGHTAEVTAVAFIDDQRFLSGGADKTLRMWDIKGGQCLRVFSEHTEAICSLWADGVGLIAVCGCIDGSIRVWDIDGGDVLRIYKNPTGSVNALAVSSNLKMMLTGGKDRKLTLWQLSTGEPSRIMQGHSDVITAISIAPNGMFAVSGSEDRSVRSWNLSTGEAMDTYEGHKSGVTALDISPDGAFVVSAGRDNRLCLWRLSSQGRLGAEKSQERPAAEVKDELRTLKGHDNAVLAVRFTPDASHFVSAAVDGTLCLWHLQWREALQSINGPADAQQQCQRYIADFLLRYRPLMKDSITRKGKPQWGKEAFNGFVMELRQRGLGLIPVQQVMQWLMRLSDEQGRNAGALEAAFAEYIEGAGVSLKDRAYARSLGLVSKAVGIEGYARDPRVLSAMAELAVTQPRNKLNTLWKHKTLPVKGAKVNVFMFMPPGASGSGKEPGRYGLCTVADSDKTTAVYDLQTWQPLVVFKGHQDTVTSVGVSSDGTVAVSGSKDKTLRLWSVATGQCKGVLEGHTGGVNAVAVTADGKYVVSGGDDATLRLWDATAMAKVKVFKNNDLAVKALKISPDELYLFCGNSDGTVNFMDIALGRVIHAFRGHEGAITSLSVSPGGRHVISGGTDATIRLWDIPTGECFRTFTGHVGAVATVAVTPNGRYLISGGVDKTVRIWDIPTAEVFDTIQWHAAEVCCVAVSGDGTYMFSGGQDPFAYLWYLNWHLMLRPVTQWDDGARAFLEAFICMRTAKLGTHSVFARKPQWSEDDFNALLQTLAHAGYGWLAPQGVRDKLQEMADKWKTVLAGKKKFFEKQFRS